MTTGVLREEESDFTHVHTWEGTEMKEWCSHERRNASSHQQLKEARNGLSPRVWRGYGYNTLISGFWPLELWENKFLLCYAAQFVVIFFLCICRKLLQKSVLCSARQSPNHVLGCVAVSWALKTFELLLISVLGLLWTSSREVWSEDHPLRAMSPVSLPGFVDKETSPERRRRGWD